MSATAGAGWKRRLCRAFPWVAGGGFVLLLLLNAAGAWLPYRPWGSPRLEWYAYMLLMASIIAPFLGTIPLALLCLVPIARWLAWRGIILVWVALVSASFGVRLGNLTIDGALAEFAARSVVLTDAIHAYQAVHGAPPARLEDLVPELRPEVPATGLGAYPRYRYRLVADFGDWERPTRGERERGWELTVDTTEPLGSGSWLEYSPAETAASGDRGAGQGKFEETRDRYGDWIRVYDG